MLRETSFQISKTPPVYQIAGTDKRRKTDKLSDVNVKQVHPRTPVVPRPLLGFPVQVSFKLI